jgi:hypothetical protein
MNTSTACLLMTDTSRTICVLLAFDGETLWRGAPELISLAYEQGARRYQSPGAKRLR